MRLTVLSRVVVMHAMSAKTLLLLLSDSNRQVRLTVLSTVVVVHAMRATDRCACTVLSTVVVVHAMRATDRCACTVLSTVVVVHAMSARTLLLLLSKKSQQWRISKRSNRCNWQFLLTVGNCVSCMAVHSGTARNS